MSKTSPQIIRADDEGTWPEEVVNHLEEHFLVLSSYQKHHNAEVQLHIDSDPNRHRYPKNPHAHDRNEALRALDEILSKHKLVGYHSTRLLDVEVDEIKAKGLSLLSASHVDRKLATAISAELLSQSMAAQLRKHAYVEETCGCRLGMTWFLFTRGGLNDESGLYRFFEFWGGESIYAKWCNPPYDELGLTLRGMGSPCIVEAAVPISALKIMGAALRFSWLHLSKRGIETEPVDFEGYAERAVVAADVLRVLRVDDSDFRCYTNCDEWSEAPC